MGVWPCGRVGVFGGGMSDAIGSNNTYKTFDWIRQSDFSVEKNGVGPFSTVQESPFWASVEKGRFRLTNPTV